MGGSSSTTTTNIPPPTAEEKALTAKQVELAQAQLDALKAQAPFQEQLYQAGSQLIGPETELLKAQIAQLNSPQYQQQQSDQAKLQSLAVQSAIKNQPVQDEILQLQLDALKRGGAATPEQQSLIDQATGAALSAGTSSINAARDDALQQLRLELAPSLGLRPGDTPILDRGGLVAREAIRQTGTLASNLQAAGAQAKLNYPLAAQQIQSGIGLNQQQLGEAVTQFQANLANTAAANRLALFGAGSNFGVQAGNLGLGLATGNYGSSALASAISGMQRDRYGSASTTQTSNPGFFGTLGSIAGGAGGLFQGLGAIGLSV